MIKKRPNKILFNIGIVMIILGSILLLASVFGTKQQTYVDVETYLLGSVKAEGLPPLSATLITSGSILIILGMVIILLAYKIRK